jgi:hypothetical protein
MVHLSAGKDQQDKTKNLTKTHSLPSSGKDRNISGLLLQSNKRIRVRMRLYCYQRPCRVSVWCHKHVSGMSSPHVFVDSSVGAFLESCPRADRPSRLDREEAEMAEMRRNR